MQEDIKDEEHRLVANLPDHATWDDLMYEIYVRTAIETGIEDSQAGRAIKVEVVRADLTNSPMSTTRASTVSARTGVMESVHPELVEG